jgi:hypothetical protein
MKKLAFSISLLAFCCGTLPASGAQEARAVVRHGESIGKLRLGMTIPQVRRAIGGPGILVKSERRGKGYVYRELGWNLGWWTVGFMRPPGGDYTAVRIGTVSRAQRTRERLGVDSTVLQISGRLRRSFCRDVYPLEPPDGRVLHGECIYRRPTGRQTAFVLSRYGDPDDPPGTGRVEQVEVRSLLFYRGWRVRFQFWR